LLRTVLSNRFPGLYVPPIPPKKTMVRKYFHFYQYI